MDKILQMLVSAAIKYAEDHPEVLEHLIEKELGKLVDKLTHKEG